MMLRVLKRGGLGQVVSLILGCRKCILVNKIFTRKIGDNSTSIETYYLPEITRQFNYTRTFVGPGNVIVNVPGGFHLESFDQKEKRIGLKSLFRFLDSAMRFVHTPDKDRNSVLDVHKIRGSGVFFVNYCNCDIDQSFYKMSSPKWPVDVNMTLAHVGTTSHTSSLILTSPYQSQPYAKCLATLVYVDTDSGRPVLLPSWWKNKYSSLSQLTKSPRLATLLRPSSYSCLPLYIYYSDTDRNQHTNNATYIRACYDAFVDGVVRKAYPNITENEARHGVKTFEIRHMKESSMGDKLNVYSWEISRFPNKELGFEIMKGSDICCQAVMTFHTHDVQDVRCS